MKINPIPEQKAEGKIKNIYDELKVALATNTVPIFFTYIAAFPEYLEYIADQLISNLKDDRFNHLCSDLSVTLKDDILSILTKPPATLEWLERYEKTPIFYNFQRNLNYIFLTNVKLALIFVGLREAVKGWAVAAKKLDASTIKHISDDDITEDFVYGDILQTYQQQPNKPQNINTEITHDKQIIHSNSALVPGQKVALEVDLLPGYLALCRRDFATYMKTTSFWQLRIHHEEKILSTLPLFPNLIFSPINLIYKLTRQYSNFPELIYVLSEEFPTSAMQRMMFSAYIMAK